MKLTIEIPTSTEEITLSQYQEFIKVYENNQQNTVFVNQKMVQIFCNIPLIAVHNMNFKQYKNIVSSLQSLLNQQPGLTKDFTLNGVRYGFIPDLNNISVGEFIDLDSTIGNWEKMVEAMSVLYRPITEIHREKYLIKEYEGKKNTALKDMPLSVVLGAMLFFYRLSNELLKIIPNYFKAALDKGKKYSQNLEKNGVGTAQFIESLSLITLRLRMLLDFNYSRSFYS